jgi:hypothetical protein
MDEMDRQRRNGGAAERKGVVEQRVKPFIQNVHHFRDDGLRDLDRPPHEHVAIFDEAQRAWDEAKTSQFMKQRKGIDGFNMSEPQFLLSFMDRHRDWAVVVCLVGGGQDIHTGEAGISSWLRAVQDHFPHWRTYISPELHDTWKEPRSHFGRVAASCRFNAVISLGKGLRIREDFARFRH